MAERPRRWRPFNLTQEPGVRLALAVRAAAPVRKVNRRMAITERLRTMGDEKALYWYAQVSNAGGGRAANTASREHCNLLLAAE